jgi:hypothetical protein
MKQKNNQPNNEFNKATWCYHQLGIELCDRVWAHPLDYGIGQDNLWLHTSC